MIKRTLALALGVIAQTSMACPELEGVDFATSEDNGKYSIIGEVTAKLSKEELKDIPFLYDNYERCKDALVMTLVHASKTGRVFHTIQSVEDQCDGGNSVGAIYRLDKMVGTIGDSQVQCAEAAE